MSDWLYFEDETPEGRKTKVIGVFNKSKGNRLGDIVWYGGWRQYVFDDGEIRLALSCLEDLAEKIKELKKIREQEKKK